MSAEQADARRYCLSIGADPDEMVFGYVIDDYRFAYQWVSSPRWSFYRMNTSVAP